jgi:hypothetical protein
MNLPPDRYKIGAILDDINRHERELGRPMLSAVLVHKESLMPGQGFFTLARSRISLTEVLSVYLTFSWNMAWFLNPLA